VMSIVAAKLRLLVPHFIDEEAPPRHVQ
jgi:hypothetical protein